MDQESFEHLMHLARIECDPAEKELLLQSLNSILAHFENLSHLETSANSAYASVIEGHAMTLREDRPTLPLSSKIYLQNAQDSVAEMVRVPTIILSDQ